MVGEIDRGLCGGVYMAVGSNAFACLVAGGSRQKLFVVSSNPVDPADAPEGVECKFTFGKVDPAEPNAETLAVTFGGYLPEALAKGVYKIAPPPRAVNRRLWILSRAVRCRLPSLLLSVLR